MIFYFYYIFILYIMETGRIVEPGRSEPGRMMLLHSVIIGILLYLFMFYILGQEQPVAENRSILLASLVLIYMILFGHGMPTSTINNVF